MAKKKENPIESLRESEFFVNPIDKTKVAENPGLLPYAHSIGAPAIRPEDMGKTLSKAVTAMEQQTDIQYNQIQEQIALLAKQAQGLKNRVEISYQIYKSQMGYEPLINQIYYLYHKIETDTYFLSMVSPQEWGRSMTGKEHIATVKMLADHTWDVLESNYNFKN